MNAPENNSIKAIIDYVHEAIDSGANLDGTEDAAQLIQELDAIWAAEGGCQMTVEQMERYLDWKRSQVAAAELVTPAEAAALTGTAESGWRNRAAAGVIPGAVKKGKQWLLPRTLVLEESPTTAERIVRALNAYEAEHTPDDANIWDDIINRQDLDYEATEAEDPTGMSTVAVFRDGSAVRHLEDRRAWIAEVPTA